MISDSQWDWEKRGWFFGIYELRRLWVTLEELEQSVGNVNPRPSGWHNGLIQFVKRLLARVLASSIQPPLLAFTECVIRVLPESLYAVENYSINLVALHRRLALAEKRAEVLSDSMPAQPASPGRPVTGATSLPLEWLSQTVEYYLATQLGKIIPASSPAALQANSSNSVFRIEAVHRVGACLNQNRVNGVNSAIRAGRYGLMRPVQRLWARLLAWYARPLWDFNACVTRVLQEAGSALEKLSSNLIALQEQLPQAEKKAASLMEAAQTRGQFFQEEADGSFKNGSQSRWDRRQADPGNWIYSIAEPLRNLATLQALGKNAQETNLPPFRSPTRLLSRWLAWYVRPLWSFNACVICALQEICGGLENLSTELIAIEQRLAKVELGTAAAIESLRSQLPLREEPGARRPAKDGGNQAGVASQPCASSGSSLERTIYIVGLFGSGRLYVNSLIQEHLGARSEYFRDFIRLHPGPTSMIYSGHGTLRHVSRNQFPPALTGGILEAMRAKFAYLIFPCRHPLDSVLTNWVWWRTYLHEHRAIQSIKDIYKNSDHFCAALEQNFSEFKAFAEGHPVFFASAPGQRFLSFHEYVEETELFFQSATLTLRLEDFTKDPAKEFFKLAEVVSATVDWNHLDLAPPRANPYGYLTVQEKVRGFRDFIYGLDTLTKKRMERIGYSVLEGGIEDGGGVCNPGRRAGG